MGSGFSIMHCADILEIGRPIFRSSYKEKAQVSCLLNFTCDFDLGLNSGNYIRENFEEPQ